MQDSVQVREEEERKRRDKREAERPEQDKGIPGPSIKESISKRGSYERK